MAFFGAKRKRPQRSSGLEPTSLLAEWVPRVLRDRTIFIPACIGLLAVLLLVPAVQGWRTVFPYQLGSRLDHDVQARVAFKRINRSNTERNRKQAANAVHHIFVNDPSGLKNLPERLRTNLLAIANANTMADVTDKDALAAFGLVSDANTPMKDANDQFQRFRGLLGKGGGPPTDRIKLLIDEFRRFIQPLEAMGRADSAELSGLQIPLDEPVDVVAKADRTAKAIEAFQPDIRLDDMLKPTGRLGSRWNQQPELATMREFIANWLVSQTPVTLTYDKKGTQEARRAARDAVPAVFDSFQKNQALFKAGDIVDEETETLAVLRSEYEAFEAEVAWPQRVERVIVVVALLALLAVVIGSYLVRNERELVRSPLQLGLYLGAFLVTVTVARMLAAGGWRAEVIPLIVTVMIVSVAYNQRLGLVTGLALSLVIALSTTAALAHFIILLAVSAAVVTPLSQVPSRSALIKVGFWTAAVYFVVSWSMQVVVFRDLGATWSDPSILINNLVTSLRGAGCCLVAGYLVAGSLPFVESAFGVVTDISLLEMSDVSHPLLQELSRRAPGTYNHSMTVASIGESAADAIGANGLLVRVGAYFHDIGKMLKPEYFIENMTEGSESRHDKLAPAMSTLIIIGHVKDGVDLARRHNLPESLTDFIEQHHGTTLVEYFYHEAAKQVESMPDHKTDAEESSFRYPGPKPQTKEAGVMMLADAVESASRTLSDPTPKRIESLVKNLTMKRLLDDQLDESSLTLSEIRVIEDSLVKSLTAIYHGRIKYPEQRTA